MLVLSWCGSIFPPTQDEYSGGRVNELTGECELLNGSLRNNNADTKGYAYLRMVSSERKYSPPVPI
jgi:hypothetical protein